MQPHEPLKMPPDLARFQRQKVTLAVKGCARCGQDHERIAFHPCKHPSKLATHWGLCPVTTEPILMILEPSVIKANGRDEPKTFRASGQLALAITAAEEKDGQKKLGTFDGLAYTGQPMRPMAWWNQVIIDLDGVKVPSQHRPALHQHDHEQIVGHTTKITVDKDGIHMAGVFSGQEEHVSKIAIPARNGFQWQLSIGANPIRTEFLESGEESEVNGRKITGPMTISRETELGEVSFVALGADGDTSVSVAASRGKTMNPFALALKELMAKLRAAGKLKLAQYTDEQIDKMDKDEARAALRKCMKAEEDEEEEDEKKQTEAKKQTLIAELAELGVQVGSVGPTQTFDPRSVAATFQQELRKAQADEERRITDIRARVNKHGVSEVEVEPGKGKVSLVAHAIAEGWTADQAELHALRASRPGAGVGVPGGLGYSVSAPQMNEAVLEAAILHSLRHQMLLEDDAFYFDTAPDGKTPLRRVPKRIQDETQRDFKARYTDQVQQAAHTLFKGRLGMHQLLECGMRGLGYTGSLDLKSEMGMLSMMKAWDFLDRQRSVLQAEGASNLSIANILANVLNKFALQGYLFGEQSFREFCAIRPVTDFKAVKSINLLGQTMFKKFGPTGELSNFAIGDQAFANQADPYGGILTIPWTHLVNDDLGMLGQVPMKIGQGAILMLNDLVYTILTGLAGGTINGDDGVAFFRTGSLLTDAAKKQGKAYKANKMTGGSSALSSASLQTAKALYDNQIDPNGNPLGYEGLMPILLHGPSNWVPATELATYRELVYAGDTTTVAKQPQGNVWAGKLKPVMSRYIENASYVNSTTAFFLLYNPVALAIIELCFLNGVDTPSVLQAGPDYQFDRPGLSIRGTMPAGCTQQNFRGGVYSAGQ